MNEIEEWFLNEFGHLGFDLTPMMYNPEWFTPVRKVIYEGEVVPYIQITPYVSQDITGGFVPLPDPIIELRNYIRETLLRFLEERKLKDFKPMQKLNKFKL